MRTRTFLLLLQRIFGLCLIGIIVLPLSTPVSAITESDKGTVVKLQDDNYLVPGPLLYQVQKNDNLHWLAAKFYGDARQWVRIYQANRESLRDPNRLKIGGNLLIPPNL